MMFAVVSLYGICWAPIKLYHILIFFWPTLLKFCTPTEFYTIVVIYFCCHWMAMSNSFVNPIVYSFMSESFRVSSHQIIKFFNEKKFIIFWYQMI